MAYGRSIVVLVLIAAAGSAQAAGIGVRAGTTGVGADFGWGLAPTLGARVGISAMNFSANVDSSDVSYDGRVKLANLNALLDWSPVGPFRLSAGFIGNNNKIDVTGQPASGTTFTFNGNTYSASQVGSLAGTVKPGRSVAPYLGIGYGNVWTKGVNFYFDVGVMFQGSPKADLRLTCDPALSAQCAAAQADVEAEERKLEEELKKFKYFPVINLGITIGF